MSYISLEDAIAQTDRAIFLGLQVVGGQIILPILLLTVIVSGKVKRHPIFLSFLASWIFSSITFSLLLYSRRGSSFFVLASGFGCLFQTSLIYAVQPWTICTTFAVVVHFWLILRDIVNGRGDRTEKRGRSLIYISATVGLPLAVFAIFFIISMVIGSRSKQAFPMVFYCIIGDGALNTGSPGIGLSAFGFQAVITIITFWIEGDAILGLYFHRKSLLSSNVNKPDLFFMFLRIALFSAFRTSCLVLYLIFFLDPEGISDLLNIDNGTSDLVQASIPLVAFFIFASEKDVIKAWCSWGMRILERKPKELDPKEPCGEDKA